MHFSWSHGIISFLGDRTSKIFLGFAITSRADIQRESCHDESGSVVYLHLNKRVGLGPAWVRFEFLPFVVAFEHFDNI